jgi:colanic acid biosynthesis glycosyl transferase WcaI
MDHVVFGDEEERSKPLKIAFISQYFYPEQFFNNSIACELTNRGHSVQVFCCVPNYGKGNFFEGYSNRKSRSEVWKSIYIERVFTIPRGQNSIQLALNYLCYPIAGMWTIARRKLWIPDVSFVSMPSPVFQAFLGLFLKYIWRVPTIFWIQDLWPETAEVTLKIKSKLLLSILRTVCKWLYSGADIVLVQSEAFTDRLISLGIEESRIRLFPNTAPPAFRPMMPQEAPNEAAHFKKGKFNLVFAGNIGESQDFDNLITAAEMLKEETDIQWVIIGSGRSLEKVVALVRQKELSESFSFIGRFEEDVMPKFFAHADALLVSLRDTPIFSMTVPYKVQCYLSCGKPIIASLTGEGARILAKSGSGFVAPAGSPPDLAAAILKMARMSTGERRIMGERGRKYFDENYSQKIVYEILERALIDTSNKAKK